MLCWTKTNKRAATGTVMVSLLARVHEVWNGYTAPASVIKNNNLWFKLVKRYLNIILCTRIYLACNFITVFIHHMVVWKKSLSVIRSPFDSVQLFFIIFFGLVCKGGLSQTHVVAMAVTFWYWKLFHISYSWP